MIVAAGVVGIAGTLALVALGPVLSTVVHIWSGTFRRRSLLEAAGVAAIGWAVWLAMVLVIRPAIDSGLILPAAGLAGASAVIVALVLELAGIRLRRVVVFVALWSLLGFAPVALALFSVTDGVLGGMLGTLDLGGALPALIATGAASASVLLLEHGAPRVPPSAPGRASAVLSASAAGWALWIVWLLGFELAIDTLTPQIVINTLVAPLASMASWLIVQRIRHARTTAVAASSGLLSGLTAITAGCAYLNTAGALITGALAGAACSLGGYAAQRRSGRAAWQLVVVLLVGATAGVVLLGVLATRAGLMFTGQPEVLFSQALSAAGVTLYSAGVAALLWIVLRILMPSHSRSTQNRDLG